MHQFTSFLFLGGFLFFLSVLTGILPLGDPPMIIGQAIQSQGTTETGAANLVTAVVLGYRGIDTLGELSILFAAATAGGLVLTTGKKKSLASSEKDAGFIIKTAAELLFPLLVVAGLYIVIHGHLTPGGGFQGGVILAAAFFLPLLAKPSTTMNHKTMSLVEGLSGAAFICIGLLALFNHGAFLQPFLSKGVVGELFSAGTLPLLYLAVGLKVGAELAGLLANLNEEDDEHV
jgi:multicomponent Na+:H+ antiporter subunit B